MNAIISVRKLSKDYKIHKNHPGYFGAVRNLFDRRYNLVHAVDEISFKIFPGELVGYIGPNGAGKSTTIKMLTGLLVPTSGDIKVNGLIPWKDRETYVKNIGAVFGQRSTLWWDLPVRDSLHLLQHIYDIPDQRFQYNLDRFREILDLDSFINTPVRSLSLGQRMRADLCAALLHDPKLLFLDEPTIGLDVVAKQKVREFIQYINQEMGTTILLTTHDSADIARLCDRVMIIDHGKILFDGKFDHLIKSFGGTRFLNVEFAEIYSEPLLAKASLIRQEGMHVTYRFNREEVSASSLIHQLAKNYRIRDLEVVDQPIEDTIRKIYEDQLLYNQVNDSKNSSS
jgi:ABC-2 type transport system ATP-binding protein